MQKLFRFALIAVLFIACADSEGDANPETDTSVNSITPPPTIDSTNDIAPMMGDTSKSNADSLSDTLRRDTPDQQ